MVIELRNRPPLAPLARMPPPAQGMALAGRRAAVSVVACYPPISPGYAWIMLVIL